MSSQVISQQTAIHLPYSESPDRHLWIRVGACRLRITPGGAAWVSGTYEDPTEHLPLRVSQDGSLAHVTQEHHFGRLRTWGRGLPTCDLALGAAQPYALTIETGASESDVDLSGLPLSRLALKVGAGANTLRFLEPNSQPMSVLDIDAGAGRLELRGLANANFTDMTLDGGAAAFICDFGGTLQRDASVRISTGLASVEVSVPAATATRLLPAGTLGHMEASDGFTLRDGAYWNAAALAGNRPLLTIHASVALGSLLLRAS